MVYRTKVSKKECIHKSRLCVVCHIKPRAKPEFIDFDKGKKDIEIEEVNESLK